jgi:5-methylcytosine-specific restriction endonuclease McrA
VIILANPDVIDLKNRIREYKQSHPDLAQKQPKIHRKKLKTHKKLTGGEKCAYCGVKLSTYTATLDHVIPLSRGGSDEPRNLVWCCKKCNYSKGNKLPYEWLKEGKKHVR